MDTCVNSRKSMFVGSIGERPSRDLTIAILRTSGNCSTLHASTIHKYWSRGLRMSRTKFRDRLNGKASRTRDAGAHAALNRGPGIVSRAVYTVRSKLSKCAGYVSRGITWVTRFTAGSTPIRGSDRDSRTRCSTQTR